MSLQDSTANSIGRGKPSWRTAIRGNVLMMGLVSLFTDFSSEMMNPLLPIFIAGLAGMKWAALWVGLTEGIAETTAAVVPAVTSNSRLARRMESFTGGSRSLGGNATATV